MTKPSHIFIVGTGRSGTWLMRQCLNKHPDVALCGETYFLGSLVLPGYRRRFARVGDLFTDSGARQIVDHIYHGFRDPNFWRWVRSNIPHEDFLREVLASDRTDRALFDLVMRSYSADGQVRGDKSPGHVFHASTLLEWYPEAKIVHMLRDPRAVFVSKKTRVASGEWNTLPYRLFGRLGPALDIALVFDVLIHWRRAASLHHRYQRDHPHRYRMIRYEDLVGDPESHLRDLCEFLGITFTESMLQPTSTNSSFLPHGTRTDGFDVSAVARWRKQITPAQNRLYVWSCRRQLREFGYQP